MDLGSTSMKLLVCDEDGAELLVEEVPTPWRAGPGGTAVLVYEGNDETLAGYVRMLVGANVPLVGVEPERTELERIFMEVTKGELQ